MRKLVIDRRLWARGGRNGGNKLLDSQTKTMCCLGFHALACGYTAEDIADRRTPEEVVKEKLAADPEFKQPEDCDFLIAGQPVRHQDSYHTAYVIAQNSRDCVELMHVNDTMHNTTSAGYPPYTDKVREEKIKAIFAQHGWDVEFVGDKLDDGFNDYKQQDRFKAAEGALHQR